MCNMIYGYLHVEYTIMHSSGIVYIFNAIQFNNFIPDSTEHIQQVYVTLRSICYIRYTICAVYKSTEQ